MTLRRLVGPPVALSGIALLGFGLFDYFFDPSAKLTLVDLIRGVGIAAMLIVVGITWSVDKVYGHSTTTKDSREDVGSSGDQPT